MIYFTQNRHAQFSTPRKCAAQSRDGAMYLCLNRGHDAVLVKSTDGKGWKIIAERRSGGWWLPPDE